MDKRTALQRRLSVADDSLLIPFLPAQCQIDTNFLLYVGKNLHEL